MSVIAPWSLNLDKDIDIMIHAMQEDHNLPPDLLLGPGVGDPLGTDSADAGHFA